MRSPITLIGYPAPKWTVWERLVRQCASRSEDGTAVAVNFSSTLPAAAICAGVVPQQPPMEVTPAATILGTQLANSSGPSGKTVFSPCSTGIPAFGRSVTGSDVAATIFSTIGISCSGPSEQFAPIASAPSDSKVTAAVAGSVPVTVLPEASKVIWQITGSRLNCFTARTAARIS